MVKKEIIQINDSYLSAASEIILDKYGLDFSDEKLKDLKSAFIKTAKEAGSKDPKQLVQQLIAGELNEDELDILLMNLTVGETFFFRDEKLFQALQSEQIKEFIDKKSFLSIWSAGCASGEEPYSISILLNKFFKEKQYKIYASDINKHSLEKAKIGKYRNWSFRSTPDWVKNEYFHEISKGVFQLNEEIKNTVEFSYINLSDSESLIKNLSAYDIIICRNVLIYFSKPVVKNFLEVIYNKINTNGLLITTASESTNINKNVFSKFIESNNAIFIKGIKKNKEKIAPPRPELKIEKKTEREFKKPVKRKDVVVKQIPEDQAINIIYRNAVASYSKSNYSEAIELFEKAENIKISTGKKIEDTAELYFYLVKCYMKIGEHDKAVKKTGDILKIEKLDYRLHYINGLLLQEEGDFDNAEAAFNKSIYLNNKFALSFFALANLQMSSGKNSFLKNLQKSAKLILDLPHDEILKYSDGITAGELLRQIALLSD